MSAFHIAADCIGRKRTSHFIDTQRTKLTGCERTARQRRRRAVRL